MIPTRQIAAMILPMIALGAMAALPACSTLDRLSDPPVDIVHSAPPPSVVPSGVVQQVQLVLQQQGTYTGSVDGIWGPATQEALHSYQQSHGLNSSGQVDTATLASMKISSTPQAETPSTQMSDGSAVSESQARHLIETQGFTNVTGLYRDDNAVWRGVATRGGKTGEVALDAKGTVVTN